MNLDMHYTIYYNSLLSKELFVFIGVVLIIITTIICGTVIFISLKKMKPKEKRHKDNLKEAVRIKKISITINVLTKEMLMQ